METTDIAEQPNNKLPVLILTEEGKYFLHIAGRWATFIGVIGFILTGFIALCSLFAGVIFSVIARMQPTPMPSGIGGFISFIYILIALFYFFFSLYVYQFGTRIKSGISSFDQLQVTSALGKLKSFFKLWGITTIVIIVLYVFIIIALIVALPHLQHMPAPGGAVS